MGDWFAQSAGSGAFAIAAPIALLAGLASFFSPYMMPLVPAYLSYVTGLSASDLGEANRGRMIAGSALFVTGFSVMFISYGAVGFRLLAYQNVINVVLGLLTIAMGLVFMGLVPMAQRQLRVDFVPRVGLAAAPLLGLRLWQLLVAQLQQFTLGFTTPV